MEHYEACHRQSSVMQMISADVEDIRIVAQVISGDVEAFSTLVLRYQERVYQTIYSMVGDRDEADDLAQEVFVKALRSLHLFRGQSQFYTWLYRIAVNRCLDHLKARRLRVYVRENDGEVDAAVLNAKIPVGKETDQEASQNEMQAILEMALSNIPEEYRIAFVLREIDDLTYEEISEVLGCSVGTVKSRLFRARNRLQVLLRSFYQTWFEG